MKGRKATETKDQVERIKLKLKQSAGFSRG